MDQTRHVKQLDQIADLLHENARLRALVEKREKQMAAILTVNAFVYPEKRVLRFLLGGQGDGHVKEFPYDGTLAGLLAAVDKATGEK